MCVKKEAERESVCVCTWVTQCTKSCLKQDVGGAIYFLMWTGRYGDPGVEPTNRNVFNALREFTATQIP